jgi:branched-chain amino acid transport system ATP-binding protein
MSIAGAEDGRLLEVRGLVKTFGGVRATNNVDLQLADGELRCVIGPNGAGKSTLFKLLMGMIMPDAGRIAFAGVDITRAQPHRRARLGIGIKLQSMGVYPHLTVRHNMLVPLHHDRGDLDPDAEIARLLLPLRLDGKADWLVGNLSHGERQWLAIGMALAMRPRLLLLDEPTAGMGPEETRATGELIRSLNREGVTVLVTEHDMAFVRQLQCRITVLHFGAVLAEGPVQEIEQHAEVRRIYLGQSTARRRLVRSRAPGEAQSRAVNG